MGERWDVCSCGRDKIARADRCRPCFLEFIRTKPPLADRFWPRVDTSGGPDACWEWTRGRDPHGYGRFATPNSDLAHRASWELHNGPIPAGLNVLHHCDNPPCVNPRHLFLGTQKDNVDDMVAKGRARKPRGFAFETVTG